MATAPPAPSTFSIDVTKDLESISGLKNCFTGQKAAIFTIGVELAMYAGKPIQDAVSSKPVKLSVTGDPSWKTGLGICFSLKASAGCTISIEKTSTKFSISKNVDSADTTDVMSGPIAGNVYINIALDFDIENSISGAGAAGGIGISGKASGSGVATLSYCHPVSATLETTEAVKQAFSSLIFPFEPQCALSMPVGSIGKVNFDGTVSCELDVTYGLAHYQLSAADVGLTQQCVKVAWDKLTPPSLNVDAGATASVAYKHCDHFGVIVQKTDATTALLYLLRSASDEGTESLGVNAGVTVTQVSVDVDQAQLTKTIEHVARGPIHGLSQQIAGHVTDLQSDLVAKANNWLCSKKVDAGLSVSLDQEKGRTTLFAFKVNLSSSDLTKQSWAALVKGDVAQAMRIGGFTLQAGSGVSDYLKRSSTLQLHFFNFHLAQTTDYFKNTYTELSVDGSIRFFADIGESQQFSVQSKTTKATIHFVATASEKTQASALQNAEVDLRIELGETANPKEAKRVASTIGSIPGNTTAQSKQQMLDFVAHNPSKTLTLINIFKPAAYNRLSCSPYTTDKTAKAGKPHPPAPPQQKDQDNWNSFHRATVNVMPELTAVASLTYAIWTEFNVKSNGITNGVPDRRSVGDYYNVGQELFGPYNGPEGQDSNTKVQFLLASAHFMNLCEDLQSLVTLAAAVTTPEQWKSLLSTLTEWIQSEVNPDWSKPASSALLGLCSAGGAKVNTTFQQGSNNSSLTCTLTLA